MVVSEDNQLSGKLLTAPRRWRPTKQDLQEEHNYTQSRPAAISATLDVSEIQAAPQVRSLL